MICMHCGYQNKPGSAFCTNCGKMLPPLQNQPQPKPKAKTKPPIFLYVLILVVILLIVGFFTIHVCEAPTCSRASTCLICRKTLGDPLPHQWMDATCTRAQECRICGLTAGTPLNHVWKDATYEAPKTCTICGTTTGTKLQVEPVYINKLTYLRKYGKLYYHDNQSAAYDNNTDWRDLYTPGHIQQPVRDGYGNVFTYGIHLDGEQLGPYYITYDLGSKYTTFSGWCVLPDYKVGKSDAKTYSKYFEVYCDGKLVFVSDTMRNGSMSQYFEIDVTDVDVLTIQYAATPGSNDLAVLCDGLLS